MKRQTSRGYTLIELALAMVVLGLVMVVLWRFGVTANQRMVEIEAPPALAAADQALLGFAAVHSRLPCPDTTGDGQEDCAGNPVGRLPVVTLGLVRADLARMRYGVFRAAQTDPTLDADLAANPAKDRFAPLIATGHPVVVLTPSPLLGNINGIDFCTALRSGAALPANNARLHIEDATGAMIKNVAYALALPGAFDAPNASATGFASPARPIGTAYDDRVLAVDFSQMFTRMSCAGVLAAASHAHANAASAAAILYSAFRDYDVQIRLADEMAQAKVSSAIAGTFSAAAGVPKAGAIIALAIANSLLTAGAATPTIAVAATAVAFNAAAVVSAGIALGLANDAKTASAKSIVDFAPLLSDSQVLSANIFTHALAADAAGIY